MKLNHINLVVKDVVDATQFFEAFFNFKCAERKGDSIVAVLKGPDDFTLVLMKAKKGEPIYPDAFHIGFMLDREDSVIEAYQHLKAAGILSGQEPKKIRDSFGFYFTYQDVMIEIGHSS